MARRWTASVNTWIWKAISRLRLMRTLIIVSAIVYSTTVSSLWRKRIIPVRRNCNRPPEIIRCIRRASCWDCRKIIRERSAWWIVWSVSSRNHNMWTMPCSRKDVLTCYWIIIKRLRQALSNWCVISRKAVWLVRPAYSLVWFTSTTISRRKRPRLIRAWLAIIRVARRRKWPCKTWSPYISSWTISIRLPPMRIH